jgi:hypothetical protein
MIRVDHRLPPRIGERVSRDFNVRREARPRIGKIPDGRFLEGSGFPRECEPTAGGTPRPSGVWLDQVLARGVMYGFVTGTYVELRVDGAQVCIDRAPADGEPPTDISVAQAF